jgi:glutamate dehydrogenase (NADP+)
MIAKAAPQYSLSNKATLVAISGAGNVAQYTALKVIELGATVISLSDSKGALIAKEGTGFTAEAIKKIGALKLKGGSLDGFSGDGEYTYHAGECFKPPYSHCDKC